MDDNVRTEALGQCDAFANGDFEGTIARMYEHAESYSTRARDWYWRRIKSKRRASVAIRFVSFALLVCGALLPLASAALMSEGDRLFCAQAAVVSLALAGLLQAMDRIFGWSSGWLRYMTTVTAMENSTRDFELRWAMSVLPQHGRPNESDRKSLLDLARQFEDEIAKLQVVETEKWVIEFNSGVSTLNELIKAQRDAADRVLESVRVAAMEHQKSVTTGSIEATLKFKAAPLALDVALDDDAAEPFFGTSWVKLNVSPGHHRITLKKPEPDCPRIVRVAEVASGEVARIEIVVPYDP